MKDTLLRLVKDFLEVHHLSGRPLLVGVSGGEDSSALLGLLLECRSFLSLDLHVAHFDHAWRDESATEARILGEFVTAQGLPFHSERAASPFSEKGNLEEKARLQRFAFFQKIYRQVGAQALILAHQREDQAETVLKRIFEGAGLLSLGGMQRASVYESMLTWRPLLSASRNEIEEWNRGKSWIPFQDYTNHDLKFLRPRMREELFPMLEKCFGKSVKQSLFRVGEELSLLKSSLEKKLTPCLEQVQEGVFGRALCFKGFPQLDLFEKQELVRLFLRKSDVVVSSSVLKKVACFLEQEESYKQFDVSKGELWVERGILLWLKDTVPSFEGEVRLSEEQFSSAPDRTFDESLLACFLKGKMSYRIKRGLDLHFTAYDLLVEKDQKSVSSYLAKNKIPARMKRIFPFVTNSSSLIDCDFCFNLDLNYEDSSIFSNIVLKNVAN